MRIPTRSWPILGMVLLLIIVALFLFRGWKGDIGERVFTDLLSEGGVRLKKIHYRQDGPGDGGKWELDAAEVRFSSDRRNISFDDFLLRLTSAEMPSVRLEGRGGSYDENAGLIDLRGDLRGYSDNGYSMFTEQMTYRQREGRLTTDEPIKIVGPFFTVTGTGLSFDLEGEVLKITSSVTTIIQKESLPL